MKILIFTASAGNGHNSTAKRLKEKVLKQDNLAEIKIVDTYKTYTNKLKSWSIEQGYYLMCTHFLSVYNYFFKKVEKISETNKKTNIHKNVRCLLKGMLNDIYTFKPDLIISTYIFNTIALADLKKVYDIPAKTMCMTLDYGISPYWERVAHALDYMFLTGEYMIKPFLKSGYKKEQLIPSGIPVAEQFSTPIDRKQACKMVNLDPDVFTVIIMKASFFPVTNLQIMKQLKKVNKILQVVIFNGNNKKFKEDLDKCIKKENLPHKIVNLGFTDQIVEYFSCADLIIGKAGGLSTTETINSGIPSLIVNKLPQQEIYNKEHLIKNKCALSVTQKDIAEKINYLLDNPKEYNKLKKNTLKLRKTDTLKKFYDVIKTVPKADYSHVYTEPVLVKEVRKKHRKTGMKKKIRNFI